MKGMNEMVRQAQLMQKKMAKLQDELKERVVEASSGGGMVTVKCTGDQQVVEVKIDPSVAEDMEMLQDLVMAAVNEAIRQSKDMVEQEMGQVTGGLKIPGLF